MLREGERRIAALGFRMRNWRIPCREMMQLVGKAQQRNLETTP